MPRWEIRVTRVATQTHPVSGKVRTVGTYQVHHDGAPVDLFDPDGRALPLSGTTAEAEGLGDNGVAGKDKKRIEARTYPLFTTDGPTYMTHGYRPDLRILAAMPGIELKDTGARTDILIHPGKNAFLSSTGCINLCTRLLLPTERIDYPGSRRRIIALIEDMTQFLGGAFPTVNGRDIANAFAVIDGEP